MNALIQNFTAETAVKPRVFVCACCGDTLEAGEHMGDHFQPEHTAMVRKAYGPMVCFTCADDFEAPEEGDHYVNPDEAYDLWAEGA